MPDKLLTCQNCHNPFVYSEYEQKQAEKSGAPEPQYCPICTSIIASAAKRPSKPTK